MRSFKNYLKYRESLSGNALDAASSAFADTPISDREEQPIGSLYKIMALLWSRYRSRIEQLIESAAKEDQDIARAYEDVKTNPSDALRITRKISKRISDDSEDRDIKLPGADKQGSMEF